MTQENINLMLLKTKVQPNRRSKKDQRITLLDDYYVSGSYIIC